MKSSLYFLVAAFVACAMCAPAATAQPTVSIVSGNGQAICGACVSVQAFAFAPLVVKVTNGPNGPALTNTAVVWTVTNSSSVVYDPVTIDTTTATGLTTTTVNTDSNGLSQVTPEMPRIQILTSDAFFQGTITATVAGATKPATFTVTNTGAGSTLMSPLIMADFSAIPFSQTIDCTGGSGTPSCQAGKTAPSFSIHLSTIAGKYPANLSVRMINVAPGTAADGTSGPSLIAPSAYCQTGPGADPYSVLTDSSGNATCTPVMGPIPGTGTVYLAVGSEAPAAVQGLNSNIGLLITSGNMYLNVTPIPVAAVTAVTPTTPQIVAPGKQITLQAKVTDSSGNPIAATQVAWNVSPTLSVNLTPTQTTAFDGTVTNNVLVSNYATGMLTITATSVANPSAPAATFTISATADSFGTVSSSGNNQQAAMGTAFAQPLTVQVNTPAGVAANVPVQFTISGPATFTSGSGTTCSGTTCSATTGKNGQASVNLLAGSSPGGVTVTATITGTILTQTFNLTVLAYTFATVAANGNNQQVTMNSAFPAPLVVQVNSGGVAAASVSVQFTISGPATFTSGPGATCSGTTCSTTTGKNGQASVNLLAGSSPGGVTVTATVTGTTLSQTFNLTVLSYTFATVTRNGDGQQTTVNTAFTQPLVVQVNNTAGPAASVQVQFTISGPGTLVPASGTTCSGGTCTVITGKNGQASINVTAGSSAGVVTVTATVPNATASQTFSLQVNAAPAVTASSFVNAADQTPGSLSPCSLAALVGSGFSVTGTAPFLAGQVNLTGLSIVFTSGNTTAKAPIQWVGQVGTESEVVFQVPCEIPAGSTAVNVTIGSAVVPVPMTLKPASPGIFTTIMSDATPRALVYRINGLEHDLLDINGRGAKPGDVVTALVTGLGPLSDPSIATNSLPLQQGSVPAVTGRVTVTLNHEDVPPVGIASRLRGAAVIEPQSNAAVQPSRDMPGVFLVTFAIPKDAPVSNDVPLTISVTPQGSSTAIVSATSTIPITSAQ